MKTEFKAFTIIELLVSMLIASIILTLAWNVYFFVGDYQTLIKRKVENALKLKKIESWFKRDFSEAMEVKNEDNQIRVFKRTDTINYYYSESALIRNQKILSDTLQIGIQIEKNEKNGCLRICLAPKSQLNYCFDACIPPSSVKLIKLAE